MRKKNFLTEWKTLSTKEETLQLLAYKTVILLEKCEYYISNYLLI